uniref:MYB transcription factor n=2 Tax=Kalanchoe fedtschenkoi TaxID=63787 RepID=A0A7N1A1T9_KALFE
MMTPINDFVLMGAPKQKWTAEEESALKAGVVKHGAGKWRTILKDPEFSSVLYLRSNVDLKDKWRNMSVMANGWGSREKARLALKRMQGQSTPKPDENQMLLTYGPHSEDESVDLKPLPSPGVAHQASGSKRTITRLDNLIMEAINELKEPGGSNKTSIGNYIEEQYWAPPNFKRLLSAKLKFFVSSGKLVKVKRKYRMPTSQVSPEKKKSPHPSLNLLEGRSRLPSRIDYDNFNLNDIKTTSRAEIDLELAKMRNMTAEEAAVAAARAVAEAEAAIAEAEEAAREAEAAEADAEAAMAFAEAARKTLKGRSGIKTVCSTVPIAACP